MGTDEHNHGLIMDFSIPFHLNLSKSLGAAETISGSRDYQEK